MISGLTRDGMTLLQTPNRVLPLHPWTIKTIKQQEPPRHSISAAEQQQLVIYSNGPLDLCDFDSSSSSLLSNQSSLLEQQLELLNEYVRAEGILAGDSLEFGTSSSESNASSELVDTLPTHIFGTATTATDSRAGAHQLLQLYQQQQQQQQTLRPITQNGIDSCLKNQSEMQAELLLSAGWALNSSGTRVWVTSNNGDQSPGPGGGKRLRRRRSSYSDGKAKAESNKQQQQSKSRQRQTHEGCSTLAYNLKRPGVEKPRTYYCDVEGCQKAYKKSCHLKSHQLTHSDEKPHGCQQPGCSMRFHRPDELKKHEKTHSRVKPFHCLDCQETFTRKDHLIQHSARHKRTDGKPGLRLAILLQSPQIHGQIPWSTQENMSGLVA